MTLALIPLVVAYLLMAIMIFDILQAKSRGQIVSFLFGIAWPLAVLWYGMGTLDAWGKEVVAEQRRREGK